MTHARHGRAVEGAGDTESPGGAPPFGFKSLRRHQRNFVGVVGSGRPLPRRSGPSELAIEVDPSAFPASGRSS